MQRDDREGLASTPLRRRVSPRSGVAAAVLAAALSACGSPGATGGGAAGAGDIGGAAGGQPDAAVGGAAGGAPRDAGDAGDASGDGGLLLPSGTDRGRVAAGDDFTCALSSDGHVACWGQVAPNATPTDAGFTFVAAGYSHACAIDAQRLLRCWNVRGTPNDDVEHDLPAGPFREVAVGGDTLGDYACALDDANAVTCWRSHGVSPESALTTPPAGARLSRLDLSSGHACGLDAATGHAVCWGPSGAGGVAAPDAAFVAVGVGDVYSCGLSAVGALTCWGPSSVARDFPASFHGVDLAAATAGVFGLSCVLLDLGRVWCDGGFPGAPDKAALFDELTVGVNHVCAVTTDRRVECWSDSASAMVTTPPADFVTAPR